MSRRTDAYKAMFEAAKEKREVVGINSLGCRIGSLQAKYVTRVLFAGYIVHRVEQSEYQQTIGENEKGGELLYMYNDYDILC